MYSKKVRAGKRRTYFFDVRRTKGDDFYLTLTESTKKFNGDGYERHKIFLYKEDFNRFIDGLQEAVDHVKTELMPEYDYDEYTRRHLEYEEQLALENSQNGTQAAADESKSDIDPEDDSKSELESEDDISW
ncbi:MAG: DNA-binding protein [Saprospiraceae bacterium]|nr:MAG: DNA-binding protein [Saprospiraceae bacterium]